MRSGKGRLRVAEGVQTVDIKVRVDEVIAGELRSMAKKLGVPMAKIVREGIEIRLEQLQSQENEQENENYYKEDFKL